ncbi:DNA polymerase III subunit chi [Planktotalea arctica]|uniref:DNA polymerase III subunit chi n=1 Tax=Planktotalea arctica TaxID=1481893 RepID=UPI003218ED02
MGAVYFYHLTRKPLEATLPLLLSKALGAGWRCLVVGRDPQRLEALDGQLWQGDETAFLAHGLAGGAHDGDHPILLAQDHSGANNAACAMCIDGASVTPEQVQAYARTCILFDGNDEAQVQAARMQWKSLTDAGCAAQYWSEESGNWQMKAKKD